VVNIAVVTSVLLEAIEGSFVGWNANDKYLRFSLFVLTVGQEAGLAQRALISLSPRYGLARSAEFLLVTMINALGCTKNACMRYCETVKTDSPGERLSVYACGSDIGNFSKSRPDICVHRASAH